MQCITQLSEICDWLVSAVRRFCIMTSILFCTNICFLCIIFWLYINPQPISSQTIATFQFKSIINVHLLFDKWPWKNPYYVHTDNKIDPFGTIPDPVGVYFVIVTVWLNITPYLQTHIAILHVQNEIQYIIHSIYNIHLFLTLDGYKWSPVGLTCDLSAVTNSDRSTVQV